MKKTTKKNNLFDRASLVFLDYNGFLYHFVNCTKMVVSINPKAINQFPEIKSLSKNVSDNNFDKEELLKLKKIFNTNDNFEKITFKIVFAGSKKKFLIKPSSKRDLAQKRKLINRLLFDAIQKTRFKYHFSSKPILNSKKIYSQTINSSMLLFPPSSFSKSRFEKLLLNAQENQRTLLQSVYRRVGGLYCSQNRLNKNNYKEIAWIIFSLKHCQS